MLSTLRTEASTLANHTSGQVGDALTGATPQTAVFYRFKLTRTGNFSITGLRVNYTTTGGIEDANVTDGEALDR